MRCNVTTCIVVWSKTYVGRNYPCLYNIWSMLQLKILYDAKVDIMACYFDACICHRTASGRCT